MTTTKMTSKAQVTIPKHIRDAAGLRPGAEVEVEYANGCATVRPKRKDSATVSDEALQEIRKKFDLGITTDEWLDFTRDR